jgi:hypothetical protein
MEKIFYDFRMRSFFLAKKKNGNFLILVKKENGSTLVDEFGLEFDSSEIEREANSEEYISHFNFRGVSKGNLIYKFGYRKEEILEVVSGNQVDPQPIVRTTPYTKVYPNGHSTIVSNYKLVRTVESSLIEY